MSEQSARPRPATVSAWLIMGGSLFVVLSVFERVAGLSSLETREAVQDFLSRPPGDGLGLDTSEVLELLRVLSMVAGACAAAAGILGFYVLQRSRSARLGLSVLAVPLFLTGLATGGFLSSVVAAAVVVLWMEPTRAWFRGDPPPAATARAAAQAPIRAPAQAPAQAPAPAPARQPTAPARSSYPAVDGPSSRATGPRPVGVVWACALTWAGSGLAAVGMAMAVLVMLVAPDFVLDQLRANPELADRDLSDSVVRSSVVITGSVVVAWSLAAAGLAALVWRGVPWARVALIVSAALAGVLCLVSAVSNPFMVLPLAACAATVVLLSRPAAREFFARR